MKSTPTEVELRGFSILPFVFSKDQTEKIVRDLEKSELRRTKAGIRHALRHEAIRNLAAEPKLLNVACEILGQGAIPFRATLFDKSPQAN